MFTTSDVLSAVVALIRQRNARVTPYRLHLILYFAQGWYFDRMHTPLFKERAIAAVQGPRFQSLLDTIGEANNTYYTIAVSRPELNSKIESFLDWVIDEYLDLPSEWLTAEAKGTNSGWSITRRSSMSTDYPPIPNDLICRDNPPPVAQRPGSNRPGTIYARDYSCAALRASAASKQRRTPTTDGKTTTLES